MLDLECNSLAAPLPPSLRPILQQTIACDLAFNGFSSSPLPEWAFVDKNKCKADRRKSAGQC